MTLNPVRRSFFYTIPAPVWILFMIVAIYPAPAHSQDTLFPALIPLPVRVQRTAERFQVHSTTILVTANDRLDTSAALLNLYLQAGGAIPLVTKKQRPAADFIELSIDSVTIKEPGGYRLIVSADHILLAAHDARSLVYGIQTLRQLWQSKQPGTISIPGCIIDDHPRFAYRGMALDVSRHLFSIGFIKTYLDLLALYKFNTFHWHLTDDQGWRIEIKQYPRLQSVAAWRPATLIGHKKELPHRFDGKRYGGYYSQQEVKEIVAYASARNITVIPEIDMPGHASAALSAYPSLGCTGGPYAVATFWGVFDNVYCAGNDSSFLFLQNVLDEVMNLFPSPLIHIGGDECPVTQWQACPKCQARIREAGLKDVHALQSYFIQRIEQYVNSKGRNIIGWDEILEGGLAPNATVMSWRGEEGGIVAAKKKHPVILSPESHLYFDYYQSLQESEPLAAANYTPLEKVYGYEPFNEQLTIDDQRYITGVEGEAWSEYYTSEAKAAYMIFPRAMALAELAWTPADKKNYPGFLIRLRQQEAMLTRMRVNYFPYYDEINYSTTTTTTTTTAGAIEVALQSSLPGGIIRYTVNGSAASTLYKTPITITGTTSLQAQLYDKNNQPATRTFKQEIVLHKATGASVALANAPVTRFDPGRFALVNGLMGNSRYNNGQWLGFSGNDLDAVIDLGKLKEIHSVKMNFLNYHWQRMWSPEAVDVFVSSDGAGYKKVFRQTAFSINGINTAAGTFAPVMVRYIKVVAVNKGTIPAGEYGAGGKALLLIDEIIID